MHTVIDYNVSQMYKFEPITYNEMYKKKPQ